jgi:hypothetical protein
MATAKRAPLKMKTWKGCRMGSGSAVVIESTSASLPPARPLPLLGSRLENAILAGWQKILDRNAQENCVNG